MASSGLSLILFFSVFLTNVVSAADPYFQSNCVNNGNFTANSAYGTNLNLLFSQLSTTADFNYGFYNLSVGRSPDQVNAIGLCRGDQKEDACRSCLNETISKLEQLCPTYKEAIGWSEFCTLHYSSQQLFGSMESTPSAILFNVKNASDVNGFNQALSPLLNNLSSRAAAGGPLLKYAAGNTTGPGFFLTIYALEQCTPDLSQLECSDCLTTAIGRIPSGCYGKIGCRVLQPSCNLRYETSPFFAAVADIPQPPPPSSSLSPTEGNGNAGNTTRIIIIAVIPSVVGILSLVFCIWICLRSKKPRENFETAEADEMIKTESLQYDLATVRAATNNFCDENKLGQGGFGAVYKGKLPNGQEVAVKRLSSGSGQGDLEFKNEVLLVAKLQHRNLVRLLGFCLEGDERLLIYEFVPNTSLDHFIFDPIKRAQLNWESRHKIIGGIARGLLYLHEDSRLRIIHRDLKASNILLDEDMNSKIADFGMARLFVRDETQGNTSRIVGTYGYMAPEYAMHGQFSIKSDVFSFGVLLLEIVSGQKNNCFQNGENTEDLLSYAWRNWREGTGLNLIDPILRNGSTAEMMRCIHIGLLCVQENVADRPTMASIVLTLSSNSTSLPVPSQPAFFRHSTIESDMSSSYGYNSWVSNSKRSKEESLPLTNNEVSITELSPR
ncbi:hypothetical protein SLEP1_g58555 [Rubroshorea leprosula]|uniref:Receptor-like protein kinase At4g00960 n=1 Tax=Rubroshorea leprosula TaxID=152421 RepID=A0AAV5MU81_9ROSI|nr:hypothetical protein SLEP1_g58555 [Rubroshorea leprosula]